MLRRESLKLKAIRVTIGAYRNTKVATSQARTQNFRLYSSGPARSRAMCAHSHRKRTNPKLCYRCGAAHG